MTLARVILGIDISKTRLDSFSSASLAKAFANDGPGIDRLVKLAQSLGAFVVLEATGGYEEPLCLALEAAGLAYHRANPRKAREFARAAGFLAKTDQVDARMLAAYGQALDLPATEPRSPACRQLKSLVSRRDQLVELRKIEKTRLRQATDVWVSDSLKQVIALLSEQVRRLDELIERCVQADEALRKVRDIVGSAPGVGPVTATVLMAELPELGRIDRRAVAAIAGLAPLACDSGALRGKRRIWGGRKRLRDALYMAALSASKHPAFRPGYEKMRAAGKPHKLALIAVARKLLVGVNAAMRRDQPFAIMTA